MIYSLGIGDILLTKMIFDTNDIQEEFKIYKPLVDQYRNGSEEYLNFIVKLSKALFGENSGKITFQKEKHFINLGYEIGNINLSKYLNIKKTLDEPYIVFHTKMRFDHYKNAEHFIKNELPILRYFLQNFKTHKKIVLLGERKLLANLETSYNNQYTIYEDLFLLKNNNEVLDLTEETLNNNPNWDTFERDMSYVNQADLNIGVGYGGNMVSCFAFSKKNCFFLSRISHPNLKYFRRHIPNTLEDYLEQIKKEK